NPQFWVQHGKIIVWLTQPDLEMQMCPNCHASRTNLPDPLPGFDCLARLDFNGRQMPIQRVDFPPLCILDRMLDDNDVAVEIRLWPEYHVSITASIVHNAIVGSINRCTLFVFKVQPMMHWPVIVIRRPKRIVTCPEICVFLGNRPL